MAIIYTYPTVTPTVSDLIVLSDLSINGKPTKTCTIESVLDLSSSAVTTLTSITHIQRSTTGTLTIDTTDGDLVQKAKNGHIALSTTGTGGDVKIEPTGNIKLGGTIVGTPAIGDRLIAKDVTGNVEWGNGGSTMQEVFDTSTPNVTGTDNTKQLQLTNSGIYTTSESIQTLLKHDSPGTAGYSSLQLSKSMSPGYFAQLYTTDGAGSDRYISVGHADIALDLGTSPATGDVLACKAAGASYGNIEWVSGIQTTKVTLSTGQVQALHTTPIELVAAPGVGKALDIMTVSAFLDYNSAPYNNVAISFKFNGMNGSTGYTTYLSSKFSDATSDAYRTSYGASANLPTNNWAFNTSFEIYANSTLGTGDSPITIWVTYKIIDI